MINLKTRNKEPLRSGVIRNQARLWYPQVKLDDDWILTDLDEPFLLNLTQSNIDHGKAWSCAECPLALMFRGTGMLPLMFASGRSAKLIDPKRKRIIRMSLPLRTQVLIGTQDAGGELKPQDVYFSRMPDSQGLDADPRPKPTGRHNQTNPRHPSGLRNVYGVATGTPRRRNGNGNGNGKAKR